MSSRQLGAGGVGKVYMAIDRRLRKQVACKIVNIRTCLVDAALQGANESRKRVRTNIVVDKLLREVNILKDLCHVSR